MLKKTTSKLRIPNRLFWWTWLDLCFWISSLDFFLWIINVRRCMFSTRLNNTSLWINRKFKSQKDVKCYRERLNDFSFCVCVCASRNKSDSSMKKAIGTISIVVVLGITWTIGYLMLVSQEEASLVFSYLFCILNTTQVKYLATLSVMR